MHEYSATISEKKKVEIFRRFANGTSIFKLTNQFSLVDLEVFDAINRMASIRFSTRLEIFEENELRRVVGNLIHDHCTAPNINNALAGPPAGRKINLER